jgi:hypothetical protein
LVQSTRAELRFTAPVTGVTAAVVGVIFNLAVFFAMHTFAGPTGLDWSLCWLLLLPRLRCSENMFASFR